MYPRKQLWGQAILIVFQQVHDVGQVLGGHCSCSPTFEYFQSGDGFRQPEDFIDDFVAEIVPQKILPQRILPRYVHWQWHSHVFYTAIYRCL
jgi:hypothetical protein